MNTSFPYHEAKNIAYALGPKPDVMLVGGIFGIVGYWIATLSAALALPWDPIAMEWYYRPSFTGLCFDIPLLANEIKDCLICSRLKRMKNVL